MNVRTNSYMFFKLYRIFNPKFLLLSLLSLFMFNIRFSQVITVAVIGTNSNAQLKQNPNSEGGATEYFFNFTSIGPGVEIVALRPSNLPAIFAGESGYGLLVAKNVVAVLPVRYDKISSMDLKSSYFS